MTLVKWTPKRNVFSIFDEVEYMMQQTFGNSINNKRGRFAFNPVMNVNETDEEYQIMMDLPGVVKKDVDVSLSNEILTVSGERKTSNKDEVSNLIWDEANYGTFSRSFELSSKIVESKIKAHYNNGVLNIVIPKIAEVKPAIKRITVH